MSPPPSQSALPALTFSKLVDGVIAHPLFALVVKKVFDVCGSNAFERSHLIPHFSENEVNARGLQNFAEIHGLLSACDRWTSTDVFMSAMVVALNQVNAVGSGGHVALQHTIATGQKALASSLTDPRFVGATDNRRIEGAPRTGPLPLNQRIQRPGSTRNDSEITPRSDGIQRLVGVQKPVHSTRTPLSEKAKATLERWFQEHLENPYPTNKEKEELATLCAVSLSSVNNWFGNKRMRIKRKMLQVESQGGERITDKVLAPRSKWNAVVVSKMASQEGRDVLASATGRAVPPEEHVELDREGQSMQGQAQQRVGPSGPGRPKNML